MPGGWEFAIDVGGTFTDVVARAPDGTLRTLKILSSGVFKGTVAAAGTGWLRDSARAIDPPRFWIGAEFRLIGSGGAILARREVRSAMAGTLRLDEPCGGLEPGAPYELAFPGAEAPTLAIRYLLGLGAANAFPRVVLKLGTTRGTNALLTRRGARTALIAPRGFGDFLRIGNQDRPRLFDLAIRKPEALFGTAVEIKGRLDAAGRECDALDSAEIVAVLKDLQKDGFESLAVCLLHATANPGHERRVSDLAAGFGFRNISLSSDVSHHEKIVARGDTTVLDAYLNPVLREYVAGIRAAIGPKARFQAMTSMGGLVAAETFRGRDCLLSGPAGGVAGYGEAARAAGYTRAIGFDMGGTSTDVSRWDGRPALEFEAEKAGVRVSAPMLAIETVAAGGGSICWFDGVKLAVGPQSAGADPGPACYGRGGPLTVTDINLVLGRLPAGLFPFPLDTRAPVDRMSELVEAIAASHACKRYTIEELARGFLAVANAHMVRAIRSISIAKGYDPSDHVLVAFGGAAGQHACAIAADLGMRTILAHPLAGVMSAFGIGRAAVRRVKSAAVHAAYSEEAVKGLESVFFDLEKAATDEVLADGVSRKQLTKPLRSLDIRYRGVDRPLTVPEEPGSTYADAYERQHRRLFGYTHAGRPLEIVAATVLAQAEPPEGPGSFPRTDFPPGHRIPGPAIISEPYATLVVDPGWVAEVTDRGDIILTASAPESASASESESASASDPASDNPDPVQLEIFNNHFASIAEQMGTVLRRTAGSTNVKERLDFSCALFTREGKLVV
ncbi:MAG: hydantoinase B/oxoprolinase family protein, partial [Candidatus Sericytochromatia bacterium]|nr:hydantoinase B/oxoprolinase family protein [Candidatus Tanganyikabacteria bacterium]